MSGGEWTGGKGSKYRDVDQKKFNDNWDAIFNKNKANIKDNQETKLQNNDDVSDKNTIQ
jgi:hypothetical protein